jgi:UDP-glucose:(heptosyl)LPS alpha-1,3-glucosyltransferase
VGAGVQKVWFRVRFPNPLVRTAVAVARPSFLANLWLERQTLQPGNCRRVVTNSRLSRDQFLASYPLPPERVRVIYNGVDHSRFHAGVRSRHRQEVRAALGIPEDAFLLLFVSNDFRRKGLLPLIQAMAQAARGVRLLVVGRGSPERYARAAGRLGVRERVQFLGITGAIEAYYGAADALVLPTRFDAFANVCLEAMACGLPVVTTAANGAAELIEDGRAGIIVQNPADGTALARAIEELRDPLRREQMGDRALEISSRHTWEAHVKKLIQSFEDVLMEKQTAPQEGAGRRERYEIRMETRAAYRPELKGLGFDRFERVMTYPNGQPYKENRYRSVVRIGEGDGPALYLKRYKRRPPLREFLAPFLRGTWPLSGGRKEWLNALRLQALGIPSLEAVAWGERVRWLMLDQESFFVSAEIEGAERLSDFLRKRYHSPLTRPEIEEKRGLIRQLASLTARLHEAHLHHRDLYLNHIFLREEVPGHFHLFLIDLHRVEHRGRLSWRWRTKDLAALNFTAEGMPLTRTDRLRFYQWYRQSGRLDGRDKVVIQVIHRKAKRISQHTAKIVARQSARF